MKLFYSKPTVAVTEVVKEDVITASGEKRYFTDRFNDGDWRDEAWQEE